MLRVMIVCILLLIALPARAQRPAAVVPGDSTLVLERLPRGYAELMPAGSPRTLVSKSSASTSTLAQIHLLLATAARTGDARLATRADALLARVSPADVTPAVLRARAFSAQHRHDFVGAAKLLDRLIARDPRDHGARLARAQMNVVRGHLRAARTDCAALVLGVDASDGMLCVATLAQREGRYAAAAAAIDRWLEQGSSLVDTLRYALVMKAEIAARADAAAADVHFRRALALAPDDVRTLAAYARYLRAAGRSREVEALLAEHADHDGLQLQRALAARQSNAANAATLVADVARRHALAHALQRPTELRDEAEFQLTLQHDPAAALVLAQRNFRDQRDLEDIDLLWRAARAAKAPEALAEVRTWAQSQHLALPESGATR